MKRIAVIGDNCVDIYSGDSSEIYVGGNAVNVAVALARNGIDVSYIGVFGSDQNGTMIRERLEREHIDCRLTRTVQGPTAWTQVAVDAGERSFVGESLGVQTDFRLDDNDLAYLQQFDLIHYTGFTNWRSITDTAFTDYHNYVLSQLTRLRELRAPIAMDFSDKPDENLLAAATGLVDIAFFSRSFVSEEHLKSQLISLRAYSFPLVVITLGAQGSTAWDGRNMYREPIEPVSQLVDTLGAGDAFIGAFLASADPLNDPAQGLAAGARYAAESCARKGAI